MGGGNVDALNYEIAQEQAGALGRIGARLTMALRTLAEFDAQPPPLPPEDALEERRRLVADAGEALWYYVVQREVLGLRTGEDVLREFGVPREVRLKMGYVRRKPAK
jgi:hypothetical protein